MGPCTGPGCTQHVCVQNTLENTFEGDLYMGQRLMPYQLSLWSQPTGFTVEVHCPYCIRCIVHRFCCRIQRNHIFWPKAKSKWNFRKKSLYPYRTRDHHIATLCPKCSPKLSHHLSRREIKITRC